MHPAETVVAAEYGEPARDLRAFRRCLSQFGTGVTVITAQAGEWRAGVTVNSFASLSLEPALVTWAIKKGSRSYPVFEQAGHFAVNILAKDQIELSRCFAGSEDDKFAGIAWRTGLSGAPVLDDVLATLECDITARHDGGDHILLVGRVRHFSRFEREPLLFVQGRYGVAVDHPGLQPPVESPATSLANEGTPLMVMLLYAYQAMSDEFEERRQSVGLTLAQSRVLAVLGQARDGLGMAELVCRTYLGARDAEDAVADLLERAYVQRGPAEQLLLTGKGEACRHAIVKHLQDFDVRKLHGIAARDVEVVRRVLLHLIGSKGAAAPAPAHS
ncbi:MAG TPA: flavin reductase family protein [Ramlibacter sp.]|nr:flavin reductase family protein [Ramlibacter sp.]